MVREEKIESANQSTITMPSLLGSYLMASYQFIVIIQSIKNKKIKNENKRSNRRYSRGT